MTIISLSQHTLTLSSKDSLTQIYSQNLELFSSVPHLYTMAKEKKENQDEKCKCIEILKIIKIIGNTYLCDKIFSRHQMYYFDRRINTQLKKTNFIVTIQSSLELGITLFQCPLTPLFEMRNKCCHLFSISSKTKLVSNPSSLTTEYP